MAQRIARPAISPLADDPTVRNVFADSCAGLNVLNGNVHITFASVIADHSQEGVPSRRLVSARVVMPVAPREPRPYVRETISVLDVLNQSSAAWSRRVQVAPAGAELNQSSAAARGQPGVGSDGAEHARSVPS